MTKAEWGKLLSRMANSLMKPVLSGRSRYYHRFSRATWWKHCPPPRAKSERHLEKLDGRVGKPERVSWGLTGCTDPVSGDLKTLRSGGDGYGDGTGKGAGAGKKLGGKRRRKGRSDEEIREWLDEVRRAGGEGEQDSEREGRNGGNQGTTHPDDDCMPTVEHVEHANGRGGSPTGLYEDVVAPRLPRPGDRSFMLRRTLNAIGE